MATSHGVVQGYNTNAFVDEKHQVIVHAEAFGTGDDPGLAGDMLVGAEENLHAIGWDALALKGRELSADSGYYSVGNLEVCRDLEVDAYIPDPKFRNATHDLRTQNDIGVQWISGRRKTVGRSTLPLPISGWMMPLGN